MTTRLARSGFSLIEALVALAIAAMTMMAIFELQSQMIRSQERAARAIEQVTAQENALALLRRLNPMAEPEGQVELPDGAVVTWRAEPRSERRRNAGYPVGDGQYEVQLYTVTVTVRPVTGPPPQPLVLDRLGWQQSLIEAN